MYKKTIWHVVLAAYVVFIFSNSLTPADLSSEESGFVMRLVHLDMSGAVTGTILYACICFLISGKAEKRGKNKAGVQNKWKKRT